MSTPRLLPVLGLLALVPVVVFTLDRGASIVWLSFACVLVIVASLYRMFSPSEAAAASA